MANIEHLQTIHAPAAEAYQALTTAKGLSEVWTRELIVHEQVGAVNEFHFGDDDLTKMRIVELIPSQKVEWLCTESDPEWIGTTISFELKEKNGTTALTLRHKNWKEVTNFYRFCNYNWAMFLFSLKSYCEDGRGLPYQERKF
ncbi:SRPBCC domain-containing protein [Xylanibacillus composti]|uniref:Activator of HSP90 ATPase n=1 Tax=Xylanibacillus composti TaxID=1572762 RepID=A0A8J4M1W4_9BACL|nr:SRPBCC domain-containing protein [Xylanibacillus composti]MDT9724844.1 SRPBCC domain-containing protein [Xylanibacillus composti]GIQ69064.1 activator of HSP90 ATPase [Xylanibacillus composti]